MSDPTTYPDCDPVLVSLIQRQVKLPQVQYALKDQLMYLVDYANKVGLYDAATFLNRIVHAGDKIDKLH